MYTYTEDRGDTPERTEIAMASVNGIYVGVGGTAPGEWENGSCIWHHTKLYVHPLIEGISENLWKRIANETCYVRPMYGKDGSAVYADFDEYAIFRKLNGKLIKIANITEVG